MMRIRSDKVKLSIANAAKQLFLERGYDATTLEAIATAAETTKRTIYGYFANKQALFLYVIESVIDVPWVFAGPVKEVATSEELYLVLYKIAKGLSDVYSNPEYEQLVRVSVAEVTNSPELGKILDRGITRRALSLLTAIFESAHQHQIILFRNPEFTARSFVGGLLVGFYSDGLLTPHPIVPRRYTHEELMEYVACGVPQLVQSLTGVE